MEQPDKHYAVRDVRVDINTDGRIYQRDPRDLTKDFTVVEFSYSDPHHKRQVNWFKTRNKAVDCKITLTSKAWEGPA